MDLPRVCAASKIWIKFIWFQTICSFSSSQGLTWRIMFRSSLFLDELGVLRFSCRSFIGRAQDEHKQSGDCYMKWRLSFSPNSLQGTSAQAGYQASIRGSGGYLILAWWGRFCLLDALFFQVSRPLHWQLPLLERSFSVLLSTKAAPSSAGPSDKFLHPLYLQTQAQTPPGNTLRARWQSAYQWPSSLDGDTSRKDLNLPLCFLPSTGHSAFKDQLQRDTHWAKPGAGLEVAVVEIRHSQEVERRVSGWPDIYFLCHLTCPLNSVPWFPYLYMGTTVLLGPHKPSARMTGKGSQESLTPRGGEHYGCSINLPPPTCFQGLRSSWHMIYLALLLARM